MSFQSLLIWLLVGAVAGWLASLVMRRVYGLLGDIIIGGVGAVIGGAVFRSLALKVPFPGLVGAIFVAFIGAVILLGAFRLLAGARRGPWRWGR